MYTVGKAFYISQFEWRQWVYILLSRAQLD